MLSNEDAVRAFAAGRSGNSKNVFHDDHGRLYSYGHHFILAVRLKDGNYLINGDTYSPSTSRHTSLCIEHLKPNVIIPFSALDRVTSDYHLIQIVDREADKYITRTRVDPKTRETIEYEEHRLGSAVIKFENKYYLSSIDAGAKGRGGYFLVELPESAQSVDRAFNMLFPLEMQQFDPFVRQGEFFFVPVDNMETRDLSPIEPLYEWGWYDYDTRHAYTARFPTKEEAESYMKQFMKTWGYLEHVDCWMVHRFPIKDPNNLARYFPNSGTGHAHIVTEIRQDGNVIYVRGTVRHTEHKRLVLGKIWHRVYVNRAVRSFSASGNVD